jgi:Tol biopolymer transport system component/imidazolonepropionase-like amidohydrolase
MSTDKIKANQIVAFLTRARDFWHRLVLVGCVALATPGAAADNQTRGNWEITTPRGVTREIEFTTNEGTWMSVDISPDGSWIVFDLLGHIYRVPSKGGDAEPLTETSGVALNYHPRYSPDGKEIAFVSDRAGQDNLWVMNADGSEPRAIFLDESSRVVEPTWTPDGHYIVATRRLATELGFYRTNDRIWMFPHEGGAGTLVAGSAKPSSLQGEFIGDPRYQWPTVSPDGKYIYYNISTFAGDSRHIQRKNMETGQIDDITEDKLRYFTHNQRPPFPLLLGEAAPELSPDGHWLAFARKIPGGHTSFRGKEYVGRTALWLKDLETGDERIIMDPISNDHMTFHPPWSTRVLPGYGWSKDSQSIFISQGGRIRRLSVRTGQVATIPFRARVHRTISEMTRPQIRINDATFEVHSVRWPASSPDGQRLVFEAVGQLWIMDLPGGVPRPLTGELPRGVQLTPAWSPDGKWIAYATFDSGIGHVMKIRPEGGAPIELAHQSGTYMWPSWSPDGARLVVNRWAKVLNRDLESPQWELALLPVEGNGRLTPIIKTGALSRTGFSADGRIVFTRRRVGRALVLESLNQMGQDHQKHLAAGGFVQDVVPSPDGRWLALHWREDIYLVPYPKTGRTNLSEVRVDPNSPTAQRLSREGGYFPRWRNANTLEFVSGNEYFAYHADTRRMETTRITLRLSRDVPKGTIALTAARLITLKERQVIENGTILVKGSRIACVGQCDTTGADHSVDLTGKTIVPGFLDLHAHNLSRERDGIIARQRPESGAYLAYGVTTIRDPATQNQFSFTISEMIEAGRIIGPRSYQSGQLLVCMNEGEYETALRPIRRLEDAQEHVNRQVKWGAAVIKDYKQCTRTQRQMLAQAARNRGVTITAEAGDFFYNLGLVMDGYTGWEHSLPLVPMYRDVSTFLGQAHAHHTPNHLIADYPQGTALEYFYGHNDLWSDRKVALWNRWQDNAGRRIFVNKPLEEYSFPILAEGSADIKRAGGYIAIGDHGECKGLGTHWEIWSNALAMSPMEALEAASLDGAHFLGLENEVGSIEVGKLADFVILNANPLEDINNTTAIKYVMKAGRLYEGNTLDELWPEHKPYGIRSWFLDDIERQDTRPDDYWDKR